MQHIDPHSALKGTQERQGEAQSLQGLGLNDVQKHPPMNTAEYEQEAVVRGDILHVLSGSSAVVALTIYRSGNGWLALFPGKGLPTDPSSTFWGSLIPTMKRVAASIPSLECAPAFVPDESEMIAPHPKSAECSLATAAGSNVLEPAAPLVSADEWPFVPQGAPSAPAAPACLRIDVGWQLWKEEDDGTDLQYQVSSDTPC